MGAKAQFRDLPIGAVFTMDRGIEAGLSTLLDQPGDRRYVKTADRKYEELGHETARPSQVGTVRVRVWQPRAQPAPYDPFEGLAVWSDEYDRLTGELDIFWRFGGADFNYPAQLRREAHHAAARLAGYARQVLETEPQRDDTGKPWVCSKCLDPVRVDYRSGDHVHLNGQPLCPDFGGRAVITNIYRRGISRA